jgi:redox-sensitive bicupin YhaK (pirin superfamily)
MADLPDPVLQTMPLGPQWPTLDPFLFCAHHDDAYPAGNDRLGPDASLEGRDIGMDFEGVDGWRMYHGHRIPGFPPHPHRGFETVTYVRKGYIDHADSLGAAARFGRGDVQWLTAGRGIQHSEMFPLLDRTQGNPLELFQIWLNLPASDKLVDPYFTMFWSDDVPKIVEGDEGAQAVVTVITGRLGSAEPLAPPPNSWAARDDSEVAIWHIHLEAGASWTLPPSTHADVIRTLYVFDGTTLSIAGHDDELPVDTGAVLRVDAAVEVSSAGGVDCLLLQGRPIGEPVARYGPFVMNTRGEIQQAFEDYRSTQFGGWPWGVEDPVHAPERGRFARHADGRVEEVEPSRTAAG